MFKKRDNIKEVEEGKYLEPKFDKNGLQLSLYFLLSR